MPQAHSLIPMAGRPETDAQSSRETMDRRQQFRSVNYADILDQALPDAGGRVLKGEEQ